MKRAPRPELIFVSESVWDLDAESVSSGRDIASEYVRRSIPVLQDIKEVEIDMTTLNVDALVAMVPLLDKSAQEKLVLDIVYKHEVGCTCSMCASMRARFPAIPADDPDEFERRGGSHEPYPFDSANTVALQSIAKSLERMVSIGESMRDMVRGRSPDGSEVKSLLSGAFTLLMRMTGTSQPSQAAPQTQRTPPPAQPQSAQAQLPMQSLTPTGKQKRVATDHEYNGLKLDQKIPNLDLRTWPGESHKGRTLLQCEPQFLDVYADWKENNAKKAKAKAESGAALNDFEKKDAQWGELNAAQYRRLAIEMRAGNVQRQAAVVPYAGGASDGASDY